MSVMFSKFKYKSSCSPTGQNLETAPGCFPNGYIICDVGISEGNEKDKTFAAQEWVSQTQWRMKEADRKVDSL